MPLLRTVFDMKVFFFIPNDFYPERFLIPRGCFSEIRNKTLSNQKPLGQKT